MNWYKQDMLKKFRECEEKCEELINAYDDLTRKADVECPGSMKTIDDLSDVWSEYEDAIALQQSVMYAYFTYTDAGQFYEQLIERVSA